MNNPLENQPSLFEVDESWREAWQGMPEFVQDDLTPLKSVIVHFANEADMRAFAKLIDQVVTLRTQSLWFPPAEIGRYSNKRYIDES